MKLKLNAPTKVVWIISLVLGVVGIIAKLVTIPVISGLAFWLVAVGLVLMLLATYLKNL
jgi:uncharacterized membrane protein YphA (DoxX/SURF4 family)